MHWARPHVNPMLALRTIVCSDRWDETWPPRVRQVRAQRRTTRATRRAVLLNPVTVEAVEPLAAPAASTLPPVAPPPIVPPPVAPVPDPAGLAAWATLSQASGAPRRPATNHPWRRRFILPKHDDAA